MWALLTSGYRSLPAWSTRQYLYILGRAVMVQIKTAKKKLDFNPRAFLSTMGKGRDMVSFKKKHSFLREAIRRADCSLSKRGTYGSVLYRMLGKEATLAILGKDDFFGEGSLGGQLLRMSSATATTDCVLLHVEKKAMTLAMSLEPKLSAMFVKCLLRRNIRYQEDLVDQLFNSSEKRLARVLLLMAHFGKEGVSEMTVPRLNQETLAEMVGTTRSRVRFFMNRFRKLGFINYDDVNSLHVHSSLLSILLNDDNRTTEAPTAENQPPPTPGGPPDKDRARKPSLYTNKPLARA
jgi:CRP/FNR family transcriptional regulator, cyclic AMP receptor protein